MTVITAERIITWKARPGARLSQRQAAIVGPELERLAAERNDRLQPDDVVNAARPKDATLHPFFTWDDTVAGVLYRRHEARQILNSIRIEVTYVEQSGPKAGEEQRFETRAFPLIRVTDDPETADADADGDDATMDDPAADADEEAAPGSHYVYMPLHIAIEEAERVEQIIARAERELRGWRDRYAEYRFIREFRERLGDLLDAIDLTVQARATRP